MNKKDIVKIFAILSTAYPKFESLNFMRNPELAEPTVDLWHKMLGDMDYRVVEVAIHRLILESTFPPSISDVRKAAIEVVTPASERLDAATAWGEVERAIRNFGLYREPEAIESMSPRTSKIVKFMNWQEICTSDKLGVIRGQFINMYGQVEQRESREKLLPERLKSEIESLSAGFELKLIGGGRI